MPPRVLRVEDDQLPELDYRPAPVAGRGAVEGGMLDKITKGELPIEKQWADFQKHLPHLRVHERKDLRDKLVANLMGGNKGAVRVGKSKADRMQGIKDAVQRLAGCKGSRTPCSNSSRVACSRGRKRRCSTTS